MENHSSAQNVTQSSVHAVLSWNIGRGISNEQKLKQIKRLIKEQEAHVVFILETDEGKTNLESRAIDGCETVVGEEGMEGKARLMAFIANDINLIMREDLSSADNLGHVYHASGPPF